ncbi:MAG: hypothetical protein V2A34_01325, partial [Lentisphaerota bacterium]
MKHLFRLVCMVSALPLLFAPADGAWDNRFGLPGADVIKVAEIMNGNLYVAGYFSSIGNVTAKNVARWDGTNWHALGSGTNCGVNSTVEAMAVDGDNVYVGGFFTLAGTNTASYIARWDGTEWHAMGSGTKGYADVKAILVTGGYVYIGGTFTNMGGIAAKRIARWDGSTWTPVISRGINGVNGEVSALAAYGDEIYVGGTFDQAGPTNVSKIARLNGTNWYPLAGNAVNGVNGQVYSLAVDADGLVYAGGTIVWAGDTSTKYIAQWNGSSWQRLEGVSTNGVNNYVNVIRTQGSTVYVGGNFSAAGGTNAYHIASWNSGSGWSVFGTLSSNGVDGNSVTALALDGTNIYVGGGFQRIGDGGGASSGQPAYNMARWDGAWHPLDAGNKGLQGDVKALAAEGGNLYAGGAFTAGGVKDLRYVARWDGTNWWPLPDGTNNGIIGASV